MEVRTLVDAAKIFIEKNAAGLEKPYDLQYIARVRTVANEISKTNGSLDIELVNLGALFHNFDDFVYSDRKLNSRTSRVLEILTEQREDLADQPYPTEKIEKIMCIMQQHTTGRMSNIESFLRFYLYPEEKIKKILEIISYCSIRNRIIKPYCRTFEEKNVISMAIQTVLMTMTEMAKPF